MPWTGSAGSQSFTPSDGTRTGAEVFQEEDAAAIPILAANLDAVICQDMAAGLSQALKKDGGTTATANIPMGGFKLTGHGSASARTELTLASQVQDSSLLYAGTSAGTDTITASLSPAITAYAAGQRYHFKAGGTNTGAATLNLNSVGVKDIKKGAAGATALAAGDITADGIYTIEYDGANFQLLNPGTQNRVITSAGAALLDDADASAQRTTLGIVAATEADAGLVEMATDAEIRAATTGAKAVMAEDLETAAAAVALTDAATVALDWDTGINFTLAIGGNRTLGNPTNGQPGTWRRLQITQDGTGSRTLAYGNQYVFAGGSEPVLTTTASAVDVLYLYCRTSSIFEVYVGGYAWAA